MTTPPTLESISARLDTAGEVIMKLTKRVDLLTKQYTQLNQDYIDRHHRVVQLDNKIYLLTERLEARSQIINDLVEEIHPILKTLNRQHEWLQELMRFKHDLESAHKKGATA